MKTTLNTINSNTEPVNEALFLVKQIVPPCYSGRRATPLCLNMPSYNYYKTAAVRPYISQLGTKPALSEGSKNPNPNHCMLNAYAFYYWLGFVVGCTKEAQPPAVIWSHGCGVDKPEGAVLATPTKRATTSACMIAAVALCCVNEAGSTRIVFTVAPVLSPVNGR